MITNASNKKSLPRNCMEAAAGSFKSGVYKINFERFSATPFEVFCNEEPDFGGWLVIQRRTNINEFKDFNRGWQAYKDGFGVLAGNYWIGLEKLHALTSSCEHELYIEMERFNAGKQFAKYTEFIIGSESGGYVLKKVGNYTRNAGDSLTPHIGMKITAYEEHCEEITKFRQVCYTSGPDREYADQLLEINWNANMRYVQMMIRPTEKCLRRLSLRN